MTIARIWNFRHGDSDDNRMSPDGAGIHGLILSAIFEFNYLMAPLGFFALIVAPALLVGMAPSLVATYGRFALSSARHTERNLLAGLALLAVLAGIGIWLGRPLFTRLFGKFRHLHYILVYPIFITAREMLRAGFERLGGRSLTQEQLSRRRRLGAVVAALLFIAGGLLLALSLELSFGLRLVDVEHVRPLAVIGAALGNAAVILGFSTALESSLWLWRELHLRDSVIDWAPSPPRETAQNLSVAHLSDLHIVGERYGYRMEAGTRGPRGNLCIRKALRQLSKLDRQFPLARILVSGDVTDSGTRAEWAAFFDLLHRHPELRSRLSFIPGNHDVNIVDRTNAARLDVPWSASQALRKLRTVLALDAVQGNRVYLVDRVSGDLGPLLADYLRKGDRFKRMRDLAERGSIRGRLEMAKVWSAIFPLVEPPPAEGGCGLILLDSNAASHLSLTNAIGVVNPDQLAALKSTLRRSPGSSWIILLHHQVVEYPVASTRLRDRIGLALINASELLAAITPHASHVLVLHGHRHKNWIGACGEVVLCSAPSASLGCDMEMYRGSFHLHNIALSAEGDISLAATRQIRVG